MFALNAQKLGAACALLTVACSVIYAGALTAGLAARPSSSAAIADPWLAVMQAVILIIAPALVALITSLHACSRQQRTVGRVAGGCMVIAACITSGVHIFLLLGSRAAAEEAFHWPSIPYALDILAWDFFFAISALLSGLLIEGPGLARLARNLLFLSGLLSLVGLAGLPNGDMKLRNIGVIGYAAVLPAAALVLTA